MIKFKNHFKSVTMDLLTIDDKNTIATFLNLAELKIVKCLSQEWRFVAKQCPSSNHFDLNGLSWSPTMVTNYVTPIWPFQMRFLKLLYLDVSTEYETEQLVTLCSNHKEQFLKHLKLIIKLRGPLDLTLNYSSFLVMQNIFLEIPNWNIIRCCGPLNFNVVTSLISCDTLFATMEPWVTYNSVTLQNTQKLVLDNSCNSLNDMFCIQEAHTLRSFTSYSVLPIFQANMPALESLCIYTCTVFLKTIQNNLKQFQSFTNQLKHLAIINSNVTVEELDMLDFETWPCLMSLDFRENYTLIGLPRSLPKGLVDLDLRNTSVTCEKIRPLCNLQKLGLGLFYSVSEIEFVSNCCLTLQHLDVCINKLMAHQSSSLSLCQCNACTFWTILSNHSSLKSLSIRLREYIAQPEFCKKIRKMLPNIHVQFLR